MASVKDLKKDIRFLYSDLLEECLTSAYAQSNAKREILDGAFNRIVVGCCDLLARAKRPLGSDRKSIQAYYRKLGEDMLKDVLEITELINSAL
ncbi:MAG: hypothetical protein J5808_01525 [Paludibacteraceae bacterium]|nr:hypothetical protein [Paludibacteraceae bacterium]